jgi:hypothetical protein
MSFSEKNIDIFLEDLEKGVISKGMNSREKITVSEEQKSKIKENFKKISKNGFFGGVSQIQAIFGDSLSQVFQKETEKIKHINAMFSYLLSQQK